MARYGFPFTDASGGDATTSATIRSTTGAVARAWVEELLIGSSGAPADNPFRTDVQRITAAGTGTGVTPAPLDEEDIAARATCEQSHSAEPTYAANTVAMRIPWNQRTTFRWTAAPGRELVVPSTANNGFGLLQVEASAVAIDGHILFRE